MNCGLSPLRRAYAGKRFVVSRGTRDDGLAVIVKRARGDRAHVRNVERLEHEYDVLRSLRLTSVPKPLGFVTFEGEPTLLLEDVGSHTLADRIEVGPIPIDEFLELAIRMAKVVRDVHVSNVIHRDICPENFVLHDSDESISLVDFESATAVPAFMELRGLPGDLEGTLTYMAPEQTGRTKRLVDGRADLYALGATYFEMLTGRPPFVLSDPLELVQAHAARAPYAPAIVNPAVPLGLSDIVMKLLAKMPEWRYQTAQALIADLEEARHRWSVRGEIGGFELGLKDAPHGLFLDLGRVYGRDEEIRAIGAAAVRVATGPLEVLLVIGPAGIGKSSLTRKAIELAPTSSRLLVGKGDLLQSNVPYAPFVEATRSLLEVVFDDGPERVAALREHVRRATHPNARVLVDAIPELSALFEDVPPVPEVGPLEAENRFQLVFRAFLRAVLTFGPPLVLFLDDLQWFDDASLKLLRAIAVDSELRSLLLVGAYRTEEVSAEHPVTRTMDMIRAAHTPVDTIELGPLDAVSLLAYLCGALRTEPSVVAPLADVVRRKTGGNPFFVQQFLGYLYRQELLVFRTESATWKWDMARIEAEPATRNLVDLLARILGTLSDEDRRTLHAAACIGHRFELTLLAGVLGTTVEACARSLWIPIREGLVLPASEGPRFEWLAAAPAELEHALAPTFRFAHDRIQLAAYDGASPEERARTHLRLGRWLEEHVPVEHFESTTSAIVDQLGRARDLLTEEDRSRLVELAERAGKHAAGSAAYASALEHFRLALSFLPPDAWRGDSHPRWFSLVRSAAECATQAGRPEIGDQLLEEGLAHADTLLEKAALYTVGVQANALLADYPRALERGRDGLRLFGMDLPCKVSDKQMRDEKSRVRAIVGRRSRQRSEASPMSDPIEIAKFELLARIDTPAWFTDAGVFELVSFWLAALAAVRGVDPRSAHACSCYSMALALGDDYRDAYEFGRLALGAAERVHNPFTEGRILLEFAGHVSAYRAPLAESFPLLKRGYTRAVEAGDLELACYCRLNLLFNHVLKGTSLESIYAEAQSTIEFYRKVHHRGGVHCVTPIIQWVKALKGATAGVASFDDEHFREDRYLVDGAGPALGEAVFWLMKLEACFLLGDVDGARDAVSRAGALVDAFRSIFLRIDFYFYAALLGCELLRRSADPKRARDLAREVREHLSRLEVWAENAPMNFQHQRDLVAAELASVENRPLEAQTSYYAAIDAANRSAVVHDEALAHELCARFHLRRGAESLAELHLRAAVQGYWAWGASAKVTSLVSEHPFFDLTPRKGGNVPAIAFPSLDVIALLKATEMLAEGLDLEDLLEKMVKTCAEAAHAESAAVVLDERSNAGRGRGLVSRAVMRNTSEVTLDDTPIREAETVPVSVIEHVFDSRELLVLGDARRTGHFVADPYIVKHGVRSVLAVPILRKGRTLGVLYFENNLASDTFTAERSEILRLLSAHIAIALENSRLFEARKRSEAALRSLSEASAKLVESIEYTELLANIGAAAVPAFADWCIVDVEGDGQIRPVAWAHAEPASVHLVKALHTRYPISRDSVQPQAAVLRTGRSLLIQDFTDEHLRTASRDEHQLELLRALTPRSAMFCPLLVHGRTTGVATFVSTREGRRFDEADLAASEDFARRVGLALENGRLHRDLQETIRRVLFMADAMRLLGSLDVEQALDGVAHLAVPFLGDGCVIDLFDDRAKDGADKEEERGPRRLVAVARDADLVLPDATHEAVLRGNVLVFEAAGLPHLGVPLCIKGKVVGAMSFVGAPDRRYTSSDVALTEDLARRAALAIENARLYRGAQEALRARDEFLAIAAHEIRGPITSIHLAVQSLRSRNVSTASKLLELIEREDRRLAHFVDELLDIGRIRSGSFHVEYEDVDLVEVVRDVVARQRPQLDASRSNLKLKGDRTVVGHWDRSRLDQVVTNLLSNAIKFGEGNPIDVSVARGDGGARLVVRDHGSGIASELQDRIFAPFERGVSVRHYGGLGLGLHIVKTIVEALGGTVSVESEVGLGSTFTVVLPPKQESRSDAHPGSR